MYPPVLKVPHVQKSDGLDGLAPLLARCCRLRPRALVPVRLIWRDQSHGLSWPGTWDSVAFWCSWLVRSSAKPDC